MKQVMKWCVVLCAAVWLGSVAHAQTATEFLQQFLHASSSVKAQFVQKVHLQGRSGQPPRIKQSSGTVEWLRPGKFRFDYQRPYPQALVGNGSTVWFYDPDLAQVQVRQQQDLMRQSPMAWLIQTLPTGQQLQQWNVRFVAPPEAGVTRIQLDVPASDQTPAQSFALVFQGSTLQRIETRDGLGQRLEILLSGWQNQVRHSERRFEFVIPAGTEVVRL